MGNMCILSLFKPQFCINMYNGLYEGDSNHWKKNRIYEMLKNLFNQGSL